MLIQKGSILPCMTANVNEMKLLAIMNPNKRQLNFAVGYSLDPIIDGRTAYATHAPHCVIVHTAADGYPLCTFGAPKPDGITKKQTPNDPTRNGIKVMALMYADTCSDNPKISTNIELNSNFVAYPLKDWIELSVLN